MISAQWSHMYRGLYRYRSYSVTVVNSLQRCCCNKLGNNIRGLCGLQRRLSRLARPVSAESANDAHKKRCSESGLTLAIRTNNTHTNMITNNTHTNTHEDARNTNTTLDDSRDKHRHTEPRCREFLWNESHEYRDQASSSGPSLTSLRAHLL